MMANDDSERDELKRRFNGPRSPDWTLPEFRMPVRMVAVDPLLLALDPACQVRFVDALGGSGVATARDFIEESQKTIARQAAGFFTVDEAAKILADSPAGGTAQDWREKMHAAWSNQKLVIRDSTRTGKLPKATRRDFMDLVKESDIDAWLENDGAGYLFPREFWADTRRLAIDLDMLARPDELIAAFKAFTGMEESWFDNLRDRPGLQAARRVKGAGGKNYSAPLFCPYQVMLWLITRPKLRSGRRAMTIETGFRILKANFPKVYNAYSVGDPNSN